MKQRTLEAYKQVAEKYEIPTRIGNLPRFLIAHIGELMPAAPPEKRGQGRGGKKSTVPDRVDLPFASQTLTNYRKVTAHREKIDPYFDRIPGGLSENA